jgi:hypothetical protein
MLFAIGRVEAKDDGRAWTYVESGDGGFRPRQVRDLSVELLRDGLRAVGVAMQVLVDPPLAQELARLVPSVGFRRASVRGPQPEMAPRPDMMQLCPVATVRVASVSIVKGSRPLRLRAPLVLDAEGRVAGPSVLRISENDLVVFSSEVKELLLKAEPTLEFNEVPFSDERTRARSVRRQ